VRSEFCSLELPQLVSSDTCVCLVDELGEEVWEIWGLERLERVALVIVCQWVSVEGEQRAWRERQSGASKSSLERLCLDSTEMCWPGCSFVC